MEKKTKGSQQKSRRTSKKKSRKKPVSKKPVFLTLRVGKAGKKNTRKKPPSFARMVIVTVLGLFVISALYSSYDKSRSEYKPTVSDVVESIKQGEVESIVVRGIGVEVTYNDERIGKLRKDGIASFDETLVNLGVTPEELSAISYSLEKESGPAFWFRSILPFLFPFLLLVLFFLFFMRQSKGVGMQIFQFGRSRARFINPNDKDKRVTFADVAGAEEAKQELQEFIEFLKAPDRFLKIGAKVPKGVMLTGAPGTGKTLLARAVAGEAGVPFFSISGSEFVEMFVGVGAARVRDLFANAKKASPAIVFIDEIDAVGRARGSGLGGGNDEREQALNQILVEMDGFEQTDKVIVLASTNRADILDQALLRPGRFDRKILVTLPDIKEREKILELHARNKKMNKGVKFDVVARRTPGFSGADLASVINEAAIFAVRDSRNMISQGDLLSAIEKVMLGPEKKSRVITDHERKVIAYHEAGHALLASLLPYADPVQKITIVARNHAGGYVISLPDSERYLKTKNEFLDNITMALGGYTAEKIVFGDTSSGPSNDLQQVADMAQRMVTQYGMSDVIGPVAVRRHAPNNVFGGKEVHSADLEKEIDKEVQKIVKAAQKKAERLLKKNRKALDVIVEKLFEVETLEREEYEKLLEENGVTLQNAFRK